MQPICWARPFSSAPAKSRQHGRSQDRSQDLRYPYSWAHTFGLTLSRCGKKRRVTSGHPKIWRSHVAGTSGYSVALDYSSLGYSYSDSYYRHLGECATAPVRAPDKTSVGNLQVYRTIFPMLL